MSNALVTPMLDRGLLPDRVVRFGIRRLLQRRLEEEWGRSDLDPEARHRRWAERLQKEPIAPEPATANEQHYEVPAEFFEQVLGPRMKYSCCHWDSDTSSLAEAEEAMLALTADRADLGHDQRILDLGCGWGSLGLWAAERYPGSEIVAVSNSRAQGAFIRRRAALLGLSNIRHVVADVGELELDDRFDRIVSVEMFEHMRNYSALLEKIGEWLTPGGRLFVHLFCHRELTYPFEDRGTGDWMARHFFTGGLMPAAELLPTFDEALAVEDRWLLSGRHYQRTAEAWLENLDLHRDEIESIFTLTYGPEASTTWIHRWRVFFMACAELFGARDGGEWQVAHYRFRPA